MITEIARDKFNCNITSNEKQTYQVMKISETILCLF